MSRSRSPRARQASDPFRIYVGGVDDGRERGDIIDISVTTGDKMAAVEKLIRQSFRDLGWPDALIDRCSLLIWRDAWVQTFGHLTVGDLHLKPQQMLLFSDCTEDQAVEP